MRDGITEQARTCRHLDYRLHYALGTNGERAAFA
jgi:hypothetical protein